VHLDGKAVWWVPLSPLFRPSVSFIGALGHGVPAADRLELLHRQMGHTAHGILMEAVPNSVVTGGVVEEGGVDAVVLHASEVEEELNHLYGCFARKVAVQRQGVEETPPRRMRHMREDQDHPSVLSTKPSSYQRTSLFS
jgi:hypothetical protein